MGPSALKAQWAVSADENKSETTGSTGFSFWCLRKWVSSGDAPAGTCAPGALDRLGCMCLGDEGVSLFGESPLVGNLRTQLVVVGFGTAVSPEEYKEDLSPCWLTAAGKDHGASFGCLRRHFVLLALFLYQSLSFPGAPGALSFLMQDESR